MKKYISAIIIIMILLINTSVFADADNAFTVYLDNINAKPNEEVEINISLKNNTGILAMLFELNYDSNCLSLIDVKDGGLVDGYVFGNDYSQIPFKMLWNSASDTNFKDDGVLATLKFKVLNTAPNGTTDVSLTYRPKNVYDVDLNKVDINVINGSINITNDALDSTSSGQQNHIVLEIQVVKLETAFLAKSIKATQVGIQTATIRKTKIMKCFSLGCLM